jgi:hypothetical protein
MRSVSVCLLRYKHFTYFHKRFADVVVVHARAHARTHTHARTKTLLSALLLLMNWFQESVAKTAYHYFAERNC